MPLTTAIRPPAGERAQRLATAPAAVSVAAASKTFRLPHQQYHTLKERALHPFRSRTYEELHALDDVTFDVRRGEFFGVVGRNGSGKSTLLKCLAGIYRLDSGRMDVEGRLSPFIELGVGFNPDLTARDNVVINAVMLGLTPRQARARFDEVIAFAGLEEFVDLKLKNYSSGMSVRLGFSVAVLVDADVLLVDEVLAVGDAAFQQKCFEQFQRMKDEGRTIVLVTHDMSAVERFCDRALLLERGALVALGAPAEIARRYNELNFGQLPVTAAGAGTARPVAQVADAWFEDAAGARVPAAAQGERLTMAMEVEFHHDVEDPVFGFTLRNEAHMTMLVTDSGAGTGAFAGGSRAVVRASLDNVLAPSTYALTPSIVHGGAALDLREDIAHCVVHASRFSGGVVDLPVAYAVERA